MPEECTHSIQSGRKGCGATFPPIRHLTFSTPGANALFYRFTLLSRRELRGWPRVTTAWWFSSRGCSRAVTHGHSVLDKRLASGAQNTVVGWHGFCSIDGQALRHPGRAMGLVVDVLGPHAGAGRTGLPGGRRPVPEAAAGVGPQRENSRSNRTG